jgi:hypothetical protein
LDDRDYAAFNDKQLFAVLELDQGTLKEVQPDTELAASASVVVQESESAVPSVPVGDGKPDMQQARRRKVLQAMGVVSGAMAASDYLESVELGRQAEASDVGPRTLEQLDHTVERFGLEYLRTPPVEMLEEARGVRQYVIELLGSRQTLTQKAHLYRVAGWLSVLLGQLAFDLGEHAIVANGHCVAALQLAEEAGDIKLAAWVRARRPRLPRTAVPQMRWSFVQLADRSRQRARPPLFVCWGWRRERMAV